MIRLFKVFMAQEARTLVGDVLDSGYVGQGAKVEEFEQALATKFGLHQPPLTVNSCTSALDLALHMIRAKPGDTIVSTPMTCTATNSPIVTRNLHIVWADVDPITGLIDPLDAGKKVDTYKAKAIIAVDWAGRPCNYKALKSFGVPVIEDAAHAILAQYDNQDIAISGGDYICWSFQAIKHLTTVDGGALKTPDSETERGRLLRWYGLDRRSSASFRCAQNITEVGYKYHMNDVSASVGLANIKWLDNVVYLHRRNAKFYDTMLKNVSNVTLPPYTNDSSWWLYTLLVDKQDKFIQFMTDRGIETSLVHARNDQHSALLSASINRFDSLPGVDYFASHEVAIPVGWWLSREELEAIVEAITDWSKISQ